MGQPTEAALEALRLRCCSPAIEAIVAASLVQRRSGGNLGALLRRLARSFEDHQRLVDEVRVATAQARFTGVLVVVMPLCGAVLAELASPGLLASVADSALTAWLVGLALVLQAAAAVLIKRLGRVRA
jgi:tight adherence protein B